MCRSCYGFLENGVFFFVLDCWFFAVGLEIFGENLRGSAGWIVLFGGVFLNCRLLNEFNRVESLKFSNENFLSETAELEIVPKILNKMKKETFLEKKIENQ